MRYTRKDYETFLSTELETQMREYARLVETKAIVLKERGDVFVGRFIGCPVCRSKNAQDLPIQIVDLTP